MDKIESIKKYIKLNSEYFDEFPDSKEGPLLIGFLEKKKEKKEDMSYKSKFIDIIIYNKDDKNKDKIKVPENVMAAFERKLNKDINKNKKNVEKYFKPYGLEISQLRNALMNLEVKKEAEVKEEKVKEEVEVKKEDLEEELMQLLGELGEYILSPEFAVKYEENLQGGESPYFTEELKNKLGLGSVEINRENIEIIKQKITEEKLKRGLQEETTKTEEIEPLQKLNELTTQIEQLESSQTTDEKKDEIQKLKQDELKIRNSLNNQYVGINNLFETPLADEINRLSIAVSNLTKSLMPQQLPPPVPPIPPIPGPEMIPDNPEILNEIKPLSNVVVKRYHPFQLTLFFDDSNVPEWDYELQDKIMNNDMSKNEVIEFMENIIKDFGNKIQVKKYKSNGDKAELNELQQMAFCVMRNLQKGSRYKTANVKLSDLINLTTASSQPSSYYFFPKKKPEIKKTQIENNKIQFKSGTDNVANKIRRNEFRFT